MNGSGSLETHSEVYFHIECDTLEKQVAGGGELLSLETEAVG